MMRHYEFAGLGAVEESGPGARALPALWEAFSRAPGATPNPKLVKQFFFSPKSRALWDMGSTVFTELGFGAILGRNR